MHQVEVGPDNKLVAVGGSLNEIGEVMTLIECSPDAILILDSTRTRALAANVLFFQLLGQDFADWHTRPFRLLDCIHPDDHTRFLETGSPGQEDSQGLNLRFIDENHEVIPVEAHARKIGSGEASKWVYFFRPIESRRILEKKLQDEIDQQKRRTVEAVKSSLRIYQVTEKMRATPKLSTFLLDVQDEQDLFLRATEFLRSEGLNYQEIAFFLCDGEILRLRYSTTDRFRKNYHLRKKNKYAIFLEDGTQPSEKEDTCLVRIRVKDKVLGILEVQLDPRERIFFSENSLVERWHQDILETIAEMLGLCLENIRLYEELRLQSVLDSLTGVYNRHFLVSQLEKEVDRTHRNGRPLSLIFVDVDGFKEVNDTYGHPQGDSVLREISLILEDSVRRSDFICRYGGDEFVIILPDTEIAAAESKAERLRRGVEGHIFTPLEDVAEGEEIRLTISAGLASTQHQSAKRILQVADVALYGAKQRGKNCVFHIANEPESQPVEGA